MSIASDGLIESGSRPHPPLYCHASTMRRPVPHGPPPDCSRSRHNQNAPFIGSCQFPRHRGGLCLGGGQVSPYGDGHFLNRDEDFPDQNGLRPGWDGSRPGHHTPHWFGTESVPVGTLLVPAREAPIPVGTNLVPAGEKPVPGDTPPFGRGQTPSQWGRKPSLSGRIPSRSGRVLFRQSTP